ncbi:Rne/Rng family ribonuclease [Shimia aestuarii]|uniref:Rne/Rng family ribonuclease n=1 Tax=Shimia aestuarii TaxID=254406 RepID=UPI001FB2976A|nr:Rne/Rng family ribonuclease [Shimia aestuarii]
MAKKMLIDATHAEETRVVVVDGNKVEEFDFESENKRQLAGNIYLAKVTRVEPSLQAAFVDYGGNRHGFLAFSEIHPDYYQIPVADREALLEEEHAYAEAMKARDEEEETKKPSRSSRSRSRSRSRSKDKDETAKPEVAADTTETIEGMETIDLGEDAGEDTLEGHAPVDFVKDTPVEEPEEAVEATEDALEETVEAAAEDAPVEEASDEGTADGDAEDDNDTGKTMAMSTEGEDALATRDPETGEDTERAAEAPAEDTPAEAAQAEDAGETAPDAVSEDEGEDKKPKKKTTSRKTSSRSKSRKSDAAEKDETIESVADDDDHEELRPPRKPRPRRYKIQEVIKVRQIMLVQVVKEERGNKGAALTTYLSLAGRYCVLMPNTARGGGISRKITNAADRKKLKEIAGELDVPKGAGLIVRTAGAKRTKTEIKRDYEYLQRMWEQIRELTLKSIAPAKIYEEGDLIKRSIRDLYSREIDEVLVEGERGYRIAKDFMKMIMPSHAKNVKNYHDALPLFARYQVESYLSSMFNPTVQLKSGGYIVIGVTEALVAIDVNSGRATKEGSIEETALKTNLEAAEEVARQLRLRDLAGLIVIDFIDMDERKNNAAVEKRMKDKLKTDRARIQVGRISGFGLMEMSRQRLRPGMIEATTQPCPHCHGTGLIRSDDNLALSILRQIEEEGTRRRSREVLVKCPVDIANYIMNQKREHVAQIEARYGLSVRIEGDAHLVSPDFSLEKFKTATRSVSEASAPVVSADAALMSEIDSEEEAEVAQETVETPSTDEGEQKPKKRRRRRSRSRSRRKSDDQNGEENGSQEAGDTAEADAETGKDTGDATSETDSTDTSEEMPSNATEAAPMAEEPIEAAPVAEEPAEAEAAPVEPVVEEPAEEAPEDAAVEAPEALEADEVEVAEEPTPPAKPKPKRRGWWSKG